MRRSTVKSGLRLITGGIVAVILATFFHEQLAGLLVLSPAGEAQFVFLGLFWGGVLGFCGILVTVIGFLRSSSNGDRVRLLSVVLALTLAVLIFMVLLFVSFGSTGPSRLRPGETITI